MSTSKQSADDSKLNPEETEFLIRFQSEVFADMLEMFISSDEDDESKLIATIMFNIMNEEVLQSFDSININSGLLSIDFDVVFQKYEQLTADFNIGINSQFRFCSSLFKLFLPKMIYDFKEFGSEVLLSIVEDLKLDNEDPDRYTSFSRKINDFIDKIKGINDSENVLFDKAMQIMNLDRNDFNTEHLTMIENIILSDDNTDYY